LKFSITLPFRVGWSLFRSIVDDIKTNNNNNNNNSPPTFSTLTLFRFGKSINPTPPQPNPPHDRSINQSIHPSKMPKKHKRASSRALPPPMADPTSSRSRSSSTDEHEDSDNHDCTSSNSHAEEEEQEEQEHDGRPSQEEKEMILALINQDYHLPGNSYLADLYQYMTNNHPLFGICCHSRIHPIQTKMRIVALLGSILFGLVISNLFVLLILDNETYQRQVFYFSTNSSSSSSNLYDYYPGHYSTDNGNESDTTIPTHSSVFGWSDDRMGGDGGAGIQNGTTTNVTNTTVPTTTTMASNNHTVVELSVTSGMLLLWTVGGGFHAIFDMMFWYMVACNCCPFSKRFKKLGAIVGLTFVVLMAAVASFFLVLRASIELQHEQQQQLLLLGGNDGDDYFNDNETKALRLPSSSSHTLGDSAGLVDDDIQWNEQVISIELLDFVLAYLIEFTMAVLVYYPLASLILFTGILGLGRLPILGGWPRDMWLERQRQSNKQLQKLDNEKTKV
jgi:hypothetical protein